MRRGFALLLVLALLVVVMSVLASLARATTTASFDASLAQCETVAESVLRGTEDLILGWLNEQSALVVLPPESTEPTLQILTDEWTMNDARCTVRVTAYDQLGMAPLAGVLHGSPLRRFLPEDVLATLQGLRAEADGIGGLDELSLVLTDSIVFPVPQSEAQLAVGAYLSTHNPPPHPLPRRGRRTSTPTPPTTPTINVNTAPMALVEQAMRLAGRGGLEQLVESRRRGQPFTPGRTTGHPQANAPQLVGVVGVSSVWSFRIDARVGPLRKSWWAIYAKDNNTWRLVQRCVIPE